MMALAVQPRVRGKGRLASFKLQYFKGKGTFNLAQEW